MLGFTGKCLCGAVSYTSHEDPIVTINCHCEDCRRSTGAVFGTNVMVPEDRVDISGELSRYTHTADSGNTMTKMFCPSCGSLVAGTSSGRENVLSIRAGSIDDPEKIDPPGQPGIRKRPSGPLPTRLPARRRDGRQEDPSPTHRRALRRRCCNSCWC